jgi:hypothetical protein
MLRAALLVVLMVSGRADAAKLVVDFAPATGDVWFAAALEQTVARELSRFHSVTLVDKLDAHDCPDREARCLVALYRTSGVDLVVLGRVNRGFLDYEVYATWMRGRAFDGSLAIAHVDAATLRRRIGEIARPIVQRGGLADERPPISASAVAITAAPRPVPWLLLGGLMLFVALPPLLLLFLIGSRALRNRPASWKWSGALIAALPLLFVGAKSVDLSAIGVAVAAGMIWGAFALVHLSWVFAPIRGLALARHDAIWPLLRSWLALAFLRACLFAAYLPLFWIALAACDALGLPRRATWMLALPSFGLFLYFWLLTLVDNLAAYLDVHLVVGPPTTRSPWHATMKRYFRGYIRRHGVELDAALLERTLFLPSSVPGVVSYGGGFARPRILVGEEVRDGALGQLPDETELPERTVNPEELPFGFLLPDVRKRDLSAAEQRRNQLTVAPARPRAVAPRVLGESATLLGWVMPQPGGDGVPLIADSSEDLEIVRRLLTGHYAAFERDADEDEIDDTDPTQKDFLFGALLREMVVLQSRDSLLGTLRLALGAGKVSFLRRWLYTITVGLYDRFLSGPAARVADAEAALHHGLHPLIQYLAFLRSGADSLMTARANAPQLIQKSKDLIDHLQSKFVPGERQMGATGRNRLLWLSQLFHAPLARRGDRVLRAALLLFVAIVGGVALFYAVREAVDYHPIYVEHMRSTQGAAPDERPTTVK